jgi:hypothetical protein
LIILDVTTNLIQTPFQPFSTQKGL